MKKYVFLLSFFIGFLLIVPKNVLADYCVATNNMEADYTYKEDFSVLKNKKKLSKDDVFFHYFINISGLNDKNYVVITNNYNKKTKKITAQEFKNGIAVYEWTKFNKEVEFTIKIYSLDENCMNKNIKTLTIITPKLNKYYLDEKCREIPDFEMCQPFYETDINYKDFYENVNIYRKKKGMKLVSEFDTTKTGIILDFLKNNICSSTIAIMFLIGIIAIIINKKKMSE